MREKKWKNLIGQKSEVNSEQFPPMFLTLPYLSCEVGDDGPQAALARRELSTWTTIWSRK